MQTIACANTSHLRHSCVFHSQYSHHFCQRLLRTVEWRLFIIILRESKWGTLKSVGNPRCAVHAEIRWICTDRHAPGPAAGLQMSPTSDTCQSVAILMNRRHCPTLAFLAAHRILCTLASRPHTFSSRFSFASCVSFHSLTSSRSSLAAVTFAASEAVVSFWSSRACHTRITLKNENRRKIVLKTFLLAST